MKLTSSSGQILLRYWNLGSWSIAKEKDRILWRRNGSNDSRDSNSSTQTCFQTDKMLKGQWIYGGDQHKGQENQHLKGRQRMTKLATCWIHLWGICEEHDNSCTTGVLYTSNWGWTSLLPLKFQIIVLITYCNKAFEHSFVSHFHY